MKRQISYWSRIPPVCHPSPDRKTSQSVETARLMMIIPTCPEIRQASQQQCCRGACQNSEQLENWIKPRCLGTSLKRKCHFDDSLSLATSQVVKMTTLDVASDENFNKMTFPFQRMCYDVVLYWASYQIRKIVGCACAGNFSPSPTSKETAN